MRVDSTDLVRLSNALETLKTKSSKTPEFQAAKKVFEAIHVDFQKRTFEGKSLVGIGPRATDSVFAERVFKSLTTQNEAFFGFDISVLTEGEMDVFSARLKDAADQTVQLTPTLEAMTEKTTHAGFASQAEREAHELLNHFSIGAHFSPSLFGDYVKIKYGLNLDTGHCQRQLDIGLRGADLVAEGLPSLDCLKRGHPGTTEERVVAMAAVLDWVRQIEGTAPPVAKKERLLFNIRNFFFQIGRILVNVVHQLFSSKAPLRALQAEMKELKNYVETLERKIAALPIKDRIKGVNEGFKLALNGLEELLDHLKKTKTSEKEKGKLLESIEKLTNQMTHLVENTTYPSTPTEKAYRVDEASHSGRSGFKRAKKASS